MNKYWLLLLILGALGCQPFNQRGANQMVSIRGTLDGFDTGTMVLLNPMDRNDAGDVIIVEGGKFSWTGYADKAKPVYLVIRDTPYDNGVYVIHGARRHPHQRCAFGRRHGRNIRYAQ
ncbi:DUF4369 domain-containing protein [Chitinophaga sedimenti]|uniref:DUF4369 domain-containing protein n=1 Tax=Chitinophaga sedimenti TaxID=2033606 RepID=UPI002005DA4E|nr:DUF4369 domain-containing protein [Chitinophaga sedimenti]MCK7555180.1 DUF4369 domain-containing protein [Chitinophaga sedimenti]